MQKPTHASRSHPSSSDADVETLAFAVVGFGPLIDPRFAQAVGQDDAALAPALAGSDGVGHGFSSSKG